MEVSFMSTITSFSVRSSGRNLALVRRPKAPKKVAKAQLKVEKPAPEPAKNPTPTTTPSRPDSNDATVTITKVKRSDD
jgi:hypothetical protein